MTCGIRRWCPGQRRGKTVFSVIKHDRRGVEPRTRHIRNSSLSRTPPMRRASEEREDIRASEERGERRYERGSAGFVPIYVAGEKGAEGAGPSLSLSWKFREKPSCSFRETGRNTSARVDRRSVSLPIQRVPFAGDLDSSTVKNIGSATARGIEIPDSQNENTVKILVLGSLGQPEKQSSKRKRAAPPNLEKKNSKIRRADYAWAGSRTPNSSQPSPCKVEESSRRVSVHQMRIESSTERNIRQTAALRQTKHDQARYSKTGSIQKVPFAGDHCQKDRDSAAARGAGSPDSQNELNRIRRWKFALGPEIQEDEERWGDREKLEELIMHGRGVEPRTRQSHPYVKLKKAVDACPYTTDAHRKIDGVQYPASSCTSPNEAVSPAYVER
ncbi:hypothetical protein B0H11DRAFT_2424218 [Mycena galericulata]|nr:hypothetical protein B0H11DRAFT_2424218 [Mycena galericulata]